MKIPSTPFAYTDRRAMIESPLYSSISNTSNRSQTLLGNESREMAQGTTFFFSFV